MDMDLIKQKLREFAEERDWNQFHSPKNLASAISVEAAELLEIFQWLSEENSRALDDATKEKVEQEIADVFLYLIRLADKLDIDVIAVANRKIVLNESKYPIALSKGNAKKYTEFKD